MYAFWLSLGVVFLAELGDKTQLVALSLAARYKVGTVLAGILVATLLVHLGSVGIGMVAGRAFPQDWIGFAAGLAFVFFGMWTLRGDTLDDEETACRGRTVSPFMIVGITFFLAELGDKTMLSTVSLATQYGSFPVWIGSSLGMVISDGLAIALGRLLGKKLPERIVKIGAACIFFAFGIYKALESGRQLPAWAWLIGALLLAGAGAVMRRQDRVCRMRARSNASELRPKVEDVGA